MIRSIQFSVEWQKRERQNSSEACDAHEKHPLYAKAAVDCEINMRQKRDQHNIQTHEVNKAWGVSTFT